MFGSPSFVLIKAEVRAPRLLSKMIPVLLLHLGSICIFNHTAKHSHFSVDWVHGFQRYMNEQGSWYNYVDFSCFLGGTWHMKFMIPQQDSLDQGAVKNNVWFKVNLRRLLSNWGGIWVWHRNRNEVRETLGSGFLSYEDHATSQASVSPNNLSPRYLSFNSRHRDLDSTTGHWTNLWI